MTRPRPFDLLMIGALLSIDAAALLGPMAAHVLNLGEGWPDVQFVNILGLGACAIFYALQLLLPCWRSFWARL